MKNFQILQDENSAIFKKESALKRKIVAVFVSVLVVTLSFVLGYVVRRAVKCNRTEESATLKRLSQADRDKIYQEIVSSIDHLKIQENLRFFAEKPHLATFQRNNLLGEEVYNRFISSGFKAEKVSYNVMLSFPSSEKENVVSVHDLDGTALYKTNVSNENFTGIIPPFNAYSPKGIVEGEPIYVNYGRRDDFEKLKGLGINCSGKVVIVRYGKISRGSKVGLAEKCGAIGVVIYSDPKESGPVNDDELFPKSKWLPRSSVQRGTIKIGYGDPLTDGYPSKDWVYRLEPENADLPKLPTQPISAYDALNIMKEMDGGVVPEDWKGMLNITYRLTGKKKVKIEVYNENVVRTVTNIVGTIEGNVEPDRYVMLGSHSDAWVYGAVDCSSGTSIMMEMARVIGEKLKKGWLPRRTIKLISWDGEEHGLLGSSEFVEEFLHELRNRGVVYLNLDPAIFGNESLLAIGSGLLRDVIWNSSKLVAYPDKSQTVYDKMVAYNPDEKKNQPKFGGLTSASDYAPFYCLAGVTSANFKFGDGETYSTYHTEYDTLEWMESYADPGYRAHLAYSQVLMHILLRVSDSPIIPFNPVALSENLKEKCAKVISDIHQKDATFDTSHLFDAVNKFEAASTKLKRFLEKDIDMDKPNSELSVRMVNDVIMQIEKLFLRDSGLPGRGNIKNYVAAPAATNTYGSSLFPSIVDSLDQVEVNSATDQTKEWNAVKMEVTLVTLTIEASARWIERGVYLLSHTVLKVA